MEILDPLPLKGATVGLADGLFLYIRLGRSLPAIPCSLSRIRPLNFGNIVSVCDWHGGAGSQ